MKFLEHEIAYRKSTLNHLSRREALMKMGSGFGTLGLASLIGNSNAAEDSASPLAPHKAEPSRARLVCMTSRTRGTVYDTSIRAVAAREASTSSPARIEGLV